MFRELWGANVARWRMVGDWLRERARHGSPTWTGDPARGTIFLVDGVGGWMLTPALARIAFREAGLPYATYLFDWHRGLRGDILPDLMCLRANRRAGLRLARIIRATRRAHPDAPLHVLSYSGGTGVAAFAAEHLGRRTRLDTLILAASALSPAYDLSAALRHVHRAYAFTSSRDWAILGPGTTIFGTVDRRHCRAAGLVGFHPPPSAVEADLEVWRRLKTVVWSRKMGPTGHWGHHTGAAMVAFIREYVVPLLMEGASPPRCGSRPGAP